MGRSRIREFPSMTTGPAARAAAAQRKRAVVPEPRASSAVLGVPSRPLHPETCHPAGEASIVTPSCRSAPSIASVSSLHRGRAISLLPRARAAQSNALFVMLLELGTATEASSGPEGAIRKRSGNRSCTLARVAFPGVLRHNRRTQSAQFWPENRHLALTYPCSSNVFLHRGRSPFRTEYASRWPLRSCTTGRRIFFPCLRPVGPGCSGCSRPRRMC